MGPPGQTRPAVRQRLLRSAGPAALANAVLPPVVHANQLSSRELDFLGYYAAASDAGWDPAFSSLDWGYS